MSYSPWGHKELDTAEHAHATPGGLNMEIYLLTVLAAGKSQIKESAGAGPSEAGGERVSGLPSRVGWFSGCL